MEYFGYLPFCLFFRLHCLLLFIPNFPLFCYLFYFHCPFSFWPFLFFLFFLLLFLPLFPLSLSSLLLFVFLIPIFPTLVSTASYILLDISSSLLLLFSNQSQNCGEQAIVFPKLHSTSVLLSHLSLSSPYVFDNKY